MVKRYCTAIVLFLLLLLCCKRDNSIYPHNYFYTQSYYNKDTLSKVLDSSGLPDNIELNIPRDIYPYAGTVSHHLLVSPLIDRWFYHLKELRGIKTFIIISPKHYGLSDNRIGTSEIDWDAGNGIINVNKKYFNKIKDHIDISIDPYLFHNEHGIGTLLPYVKKYFPNAKIVPIVMDEFKKQVSLCNDLSEVLSGIIKRDKKSFLIISTDFSHRADLNTTKKRDKISMKTLNSFDVNQVKNIYSDNNVGIITLFFIAEKLLKKNTHILYNTNSVEFTGNYDIDDITSYFFSYQF